MPNDDIAGELTAVDPSLVGVIPAAGYATRMGPLASSKEVIPVDGKPVMAHLIRRLRASGCGDVRVVTRSEKLDVIAYAEEEGLTVIEAAPPSVTESVLIGLESVDADRIVLLGFPDTIWEPMDGFGVLTEALGPDTGVALGLFRTTEPERSDVVTVTPDGKVSSVEVKPASPSSSLIWGCAAARLSALEELREHSELGTAFDALARRGQVVGVFLSDSWIDIGTPEALAEYTGRG